MDGFRDGCACHANPGSGIHAMFIWHQYFLCVHYWSANMMECRFPGAGCEWMNRSFDTKPTVGTLGMLVC